jgi:hypothetical protein
MKLRRHGLARRTAGTGQEHRAFFLIFVITIVPVAAATFLIGSSVRPDLYDVTPEPLEEGVQAVTWRTLEDLAHHSRLKSARGDLFGPEVQMIGYMIELEGSREENGVVTRFLLVPNPGHWFHPPHLHPSKTVHVHLQDDRTVPLIERVAIVARGTLSIQSGQLGFEDAIYQLRASDIQIANP